MGPSVDTLTFRAVFEVVLMYNGAFIVAELFNTVLPETLNDENTVTLFEVTLFNVVGPETFNDENTVTLFEVTLFNVVKPDIFNDVIIVTLFDVKLYALTSYIPELLTL
jgi:hypothetical protein